MKLAPKPEKSDAKTEKPEKHEIGKDLHGLIKISSVRMTA